MTAPRQVQAQTLLCVGGSADGQRITIPVDMELWLSKDREVYQRTKWAAGNFVMSIMLLRGLAPEEALQMLVNNYTVESARENSWDPDDFPLPPWAIRRSKGNYMEEGAQLATRDGRRFGNAYVDRIEPHDKLGRVAVVITDMGSVMRMTVHELQTGFYPPAYVMKIEEARSARLRLGRN